MRQGTKLALWVVGGLALFILVQKEASSAVNLEVFRGFILSYGRMAPIVFLGVYIGTTMLFVSTALMSVFAGLLFGNVYGTVYATIGATIAGMISFYLSRRYGLNFSKKLERADSKLVRRIRDELKEHGFRGFFFIRLLFLPYMAVSYTSGLIREARVSDYFWATLLTNALYGFLFVSLGERLMQGWKAIILPTAAILLVLCIPEAINRMRKRPAKK